MDLFERFLYFLQGEMETPKTLGWFHILWIVLTIAAILYCCIYRRNDSEKRVRQVVFWTSLVVILLEVYKQVNYTFGYSSDVVTTDYQWYAFPFQFCSMPMYVGLLMGLSKKGRFHHDVRV